jgi:hypothetical protein
MKYRNLSGLLAGCIFLCGCTTNKHEPSVEVRPVYRSARAIEGALLVGISYGEFGTLVREMSKELVLARDRVKFSGASDPLSARILDKYGALLEMYKDSATVWQLQIQEKTYADELPALANKYGVSSAVVDRTDRSFGITSHPRYVNYDQIREAIWSKATRFQEELLPEVYGVFAALPAPQQKH